ncbi:MAG TPA: hypothetical protein VIK56_08355, partial [Rhodoferax sp.]
MRTQFDGQCQVSAEAVQKHNAEVAGYSGDPARLMRTSVFPFRWGKTNDRFKQPWLTAMGTDLPHGPFL